jgi:hypothetical protein
MSRAEDDAYRATLIRPRKTDRSAPRDPFVHGERTP